MKHLLSLSLLGFPFFSMIHSFAMILKTFLCDLNDLQSTPYLTCDLEQLLNFPGYVVMTTDTVATIDIFGLMNILYGKIKDLRNFPIAQQAKGVQYTYPFLVFLNPTSGCGIFNSAIFKILIQRPSYKEVLSPHNFVTPGQSISNSQRKI